MQAEQAGVDGEFPQICGRELGLDNIKSTDLMAVFLKFVRPGGKDTRFDIPSDLKERWTEELEDTKEIFPRKQEEESQTRFRRRQRGWKNWTRRSRKIAEGG